MSTREPERQEPRGIECRCAGCGHEGLAVADGRRAQCPNCGESFAVRVVDGFALVEDDGWTVTVALDVPEELADGPGPE